MESTPCVIQTSYREGLTSGKGRGWWEGLPGEVAFELALKMWASFPHVGIKESIFKMKEIA